MRSHNSLNDKRKNIDYSIPQCGTMDDLRREIDHLDCRIVELLSIRQDFIEQAAHIKQDRNLVRDEKRVEDVVAKVISHANHVGTHPDMVEKLYRNMIEWSINYEMGVFDSTK